jgi:hypothetical protein
MSTGVAPHSQPKLTRFDESAIAIECRMPGWCERRRLLVLLERSVRERGCAP